MFFVVAGIISFHFFAPSVPLRSGGSVTLTGTGPPVLLSTGLYGTMPAWLYSDFVNALRVNFTVVMPNGVAVVNADLVRDVTEALSVDSVGLVAHSSLDSHLIELEEVATVVLCDPVVVPKFEFGSIRRHRVHRSCPCLVIRAALTYESGPGGIPIPGFLFPDLPVNSTIVHVLDGVGHADLLDDRWAALGAQLPWMRGANAPQQPFFDWTFEAKRGANSVAARRRAYRATVARLAYEHMSRNGSDCSLVQVK